MSESSHGSTVKCMVPNGQTEPGPLRTLGQQVTGKGGGRWCQGGLLASFLFTSSILFSLQYVFVLIHESETIHTDPRLRLESSKEIARV